MPLRPLRNATITFGLVLIDIMQALRRSLEGGRTPARRAPARGRAAPSKKRKAS